MRFKGRKTTLFIVLLIAITLLVACKKDKEVSDEPAPSDTAEKEEIAKTEESAEEIFEKLFDINNKIAIDINITEDELKLLQEDYDKYSAIGSKSPIYRETDLSISISTQAGTDVYEFENVGIRMKGNTSRTDFYSSGNGKYNLIHFKIKFPDTFAGLDNLDIRWNKLDDSTYIREYYACEFYRNNGILAPHINLASVDVAGVHEGVFTIVEPVDKTFIERYLPEKDWDGDLYKCGWDIVGAMLTTDMSIGIEDEEKGEFYNYDLKNNKKTSDNQLLNNLIAELNDGDVTKEELKELVDMEYFLRFAATSYFVGNPDDMRNDYNNYYIYFLKSNNKAIFIPIDNDRCFGLTKEWNPTGDALVSVDPFSTLADGANEEQKNPLFIYTVDAGGYYIDEYASSLKEVAKSEWLTIDKFNSIYEIAYNNYKDDTKPDKSYENAAWHSFKFDNASSDGLLTSTGNASFAEYLQAKMSYYNEYIANVEDYYEYIDLGDEPEQNENQGVPDNIGKGYSIRGTFNDWVFEDEYIMSYDPDTDTYSYTITLDSQAWLKIASNDDWDWYGYENVISAQDTSFLTYDNEHYNLILEAGVYEIRMNGLSYLIEIERMS